MNKIVIDGVIGRGEGEYSSTRFSAELAACDTSEPLGVIIHSEGGSVFEGFKIHDALAAWPGKKIAYIQSSAFSIASYIPMACDEIEITPNGYLMLHNPYAEVEGDDEVMTQNAVLLKDMKTKMIDAYSRKSGRSSEELTEVLRKQTYLNARDALNMGLVNRIASTPIACRRFEVRNMPQVVFSALFGAGESGNNVKHLENTMSETKAKVAATVKQIRSAFPKAKSETIIRCMEKEMDMEEVATAMTDEVLQENETLSAKVKALEEEVMALRAKAEEPEEPSAQEDEEKVVAKAKAKRGVQPVAKAGGFGGACPREKWDNAVSAYVAKGYTKIRAVQAVNRDNPGLRESLVEQANA